MGEKIERKALSRYFARRQEMKVLEADEAQRDALRQVLCLVWLW